MRFTNAAADPSARLESRRRQLQLERELAVRRLDEVGPQAACDLRAAWRNYCEVIAELDDTTAALRQLRDRTG